MQPRSPVGGENRFDALPEPTPPPSPMRALSWVLFIAFTVWIHYEVKIAEGSVAPNSLGKVKVGDAAPDFTAFDLDGTELNLASLETEEVVLMEFWATWCGPCVMSLPKLQKLHDELDGTGVRILAVNNGESKEHVQKWIKKKGYSFTTIIDEKRSIARKYGVRSLPSLLIVGRDGVVELIQSGYGGYSQVKRRLEELSSKSARLTEPRPSQEAVAATAPPSTSARRPMGYGTGS